MIIVKKVFSTFNMEVYQNILFFMLSNIYEKIKQSMKKEFFCSKKDVFIFLKRILKKLEGRKCTGSGQPAFDFLENLEFLARNPGFLNFSGKNSGFLNFLEGILDS